jgi:hypothetical protein
MRYLSTAALLALTVAYASGARAQDDLSPQSAPAAPPSAPVADVCSAPGALTPSKPKAVGKTSGCPSGQEAGACVLYDKPWSNSCAAQASNASLGVHWDYFGKSDCRTNQANGLARRTLTDVNRIVIHNGGTPEKNYDSWKCRTASSHYTIARDGGIYQHIGEELDAWTAMQWNKNSIGIELTTDGDCSTNDEKYIKEKNALTKYKDVVAKICGPTDAQYESLKKLVAAIAGRTSASFDVRHVVGHCENGTASDPMAFDWSRIGLSNADKKKFMKTEAGADCRWYDYDDPVASAAKP